LPTERLQRRLGADNESPDGADGEPDTSLSRWLPDTTTSARYVTYDAPYLKKAFETAGFTDFKIDNAQGSATTMQTQADSLLREALDCYDDGAIEEADLSVIGLTLEQFHHAVADRRAVLGAPAADMPRMWAMPS